MRVGVIGLGAAGARAARQLISSPEVSEVALYDPDPRRLMGSVESLGDGVIVAAGVQEAVEGAGAVVLAHPGSHTGLAKAALDGGANVVSLGALESVVRPLLDLQDHAQARGRSLVVGAGFAPGLSTLLARHFSTEFDQLEEVHVASVGSGGNACRKDRRIAVSAGGRDWIDGAWVARSGSKSVQRWFPDPIGARECVAAGGGDALLCIDAFPDLGRATFRVAKRESWSLGLQRLLGGVELPLWAGGSMEDDLGGVAVELRGSANFGKHVVLLGAVDRPALAAGTVGALCAIWASQGRLARLGAGGLGSMVSETGSFLQRLATLGVKGAVFEPASPRQGFPDAQP